MFLKPPVLRTFPLQFEGGSEEGWGDGVRNIVDTERKLFYVPLCAVSPMAQDSLPKPRCLVVRRGFLFSLNIVAFDCPLAYFVCSYITYRAISDIAGRRLDSNSKKIHTENYILYKTNKIHWLLNGNADMVYLNIG
jgi:hypothetical protein